MAASEESCHPRYYDYDYDCDDDDYDDDDVDDDDNDDDDDYKDDSAKYQQGEIDCTERFHMTSRSHIGVPKQ